MANAFFAVLPRLLALTFLAGTFSGCAIRRAPLPETPGQHVFITYWGADGQPNSGQNPEGLRLAVKDSIDMKGTVTTAGTEYLEKTAAPAKQDAALMAIARERNVRIIGKTNLTELALGVSGINDYFGTPRSPLKRRMIPGGSSSGSAVAVATGFADVAFGTDTAGSIRVPAACCGVYGLKTTHGLISLKGVAPISPVHLDTVGPMAKDLPRLVQGMDLLQRGFAAQYAAAKARTPAPRAIRVGRLYVPGTDRAIDSAVDAALAAAGFQVVKMGPEFTRRWGEAQDVAGRLALADGWFHDRKYTDKSGITMITKAMIRLGEIEYTNNYPEILRGRRSWQWTLRNALQGVDYIALPTLKRIPPNVPFFGRSALFESGVYALQNTSPVNLAGNPAVAVPIPLANRSKSMTSLQLIGPRFSEAELLNVARLVAEPTVVPLPAGTNPRSPRTARR